MINNIPQELRQLQQWVCARADKAPIDPKTGEAAKVNCPDTWGTFDQAVQADYPHVGFVLTEADPFTIIDLDEPEKEEQAERHRKIVEAFPSYSEVSQSGRGLHIIVRGRVPTGVHRDKVEVYSDRRYMICTGNTYRDLPITDCQETLDRLYGQMRPAPVIALEDGEEVQSDAELVDMASNAVNGDKFTRLCNGEWEGEYQSASEADMALLSILAYYSRNDEQVRRLFRMSVLGKRDKHRGTDYRINWALGKIRAQEPAPVDLSALEAQVAKVKAPVETRASAALPPPPGLVGDLAQFIYDTAIRPTPEVALVAALGLVAGIAGRAYCASEPPTGLNLYLILLAKTGAGKEGGKQAINQLLAEVRPRVPMVDRFVGPTTFGSGQALGKYFYESPCFYSVLDEFGHTLKSITSPKASSAEQMFHKQLLALYSQSGPNGYIGVHAYSDKEKNIPSVRAPSLTIIAESTPDVLFDCLDSALVQDGLVPRLLVVEYTGKRPRRNRQAGGKPDAGLVQRFAELATVALSAEQNSSFAKVALSPEAEAQLDAFDSKCDDHIDNGSSVEVQLWNRAHLNALRVASVIAVGCNPHQPVVTEDHARWAIDFVRRSVNTVSSRFDKGEVGGGDGAKAEAAIRSAVTAFITMPPDQRETYKTPKPFQTGKVIPHSYLYAKLKRVQPFKTDRRILEETLKTLVEVGTLQQLPPPQVREQYNLNTKAYAVGPSW